MWDCEYDNYPALENHLFSGLKWKKNVGIDKYNYSGYDIGYGIPCLENFSIANGFGKNIIFGFDMSSSMQLVKNIF